MEFALVPQTPAGERFVKLAEDQARFVAERAADHDRDGTFPRDAFDSMYDAGMLRATVPEELGGLGLTSMRDLAVGLGRVARGDGSVAIALNTHLATTWMIARVWRDTVATGLDASNTTRVLEQIADGAVTMAAFTEPGTDAQRPLAHLARVPGGWLLNGRKSFATSSPVADVLFILCRSVDDKGDAQAHWAMVHSDADGVHVLDNWDALGLRATGSHDLVLEDVFVRNGEVMPPVPWGRDHELSLIITVTAQIGMAGCFLGIAERAHELARRTARTQSKAPDGSLLAGRAGVQHAIAENEIDLVTCRALLDRAGNMIDREVTEPLEAPSVGELHILNAQFQAARHALGTRTVAVVDRSMAVAGDIAYLASHPLARLSRDVRATGLLQPFASIDVHEYIGKVALGLDPVIQD